MNHKQLILLKNTLLAAMGAVILTIGVLYSYFRGFTPLSAYQLSIVFSVFWIVNGIVVSLIVFNLNTRFKDPSMSFFQMYWASFSSISALMLTTGIDPLFYLSVLVPMVFGVFRLQVKQFQIYTIIVTFYLLVVSVFRSVVIFEPVDLFNSLIVFLAFSFCAFTLSSLCKSFVRLQDRLRQKNEELAHAVQARTYFLANMSHEIRTPMNGVLGMIDISLGEELSKKVRHNLLVAKDSGRALLAVINDILDFSKIEAGKLELDISAFDLHRLLNDVILPFKAMTYKNGIDLVLKYEENVPNYIYTDSGRLRQILNNLIGNAIKFTSVGAINVSVSACSVDCLDGGLNKSHLIIKFSILDTGIGIPEEKLQDLFEHFTQADVTTTRKYGGTGLGLAIVKNLCQLLGGDVIVSSLEGKGSTFKFTIKAERACTGDVKELAVKESARYFSSGVRVLVVEDHKVNQEVAQMTLESLGADVTIANHGKEALEVLLRDSSGRPVFDIIFMDCQMPFLDGYEATQRIRTQSIYSSYKDIPIVAMTANAMKGDREHCLEAGMNDYVSKPIDVSELSLAISTWVNIGTSDDKRVVKTSPFPSKREVLEVQSPHRRQTWNKVVLLNLVGGNMGLVVNLLDSFYKSLDAHVSEILKSIEGRRVDELKKQIHSLKGVAANLQFECLTDVCREIEDQLCSGNPSFQAELIESFILEIDAVKKVLSANMNQG